MIIIPLIALTVLTAVTQNRAIDFGSKEILGVRYNRNVLAVLHLIQLHRSLSEFSDRNNQSVQAKKREFKKSWIRLS